MFNIPEPDLQIAFSAALVRLRDSYLQDALRKTVGGLLTTAIDRELAEFVDGPSLAALASKGLRGELVFPVPIVLQANPSLLGYYRLLYGYSQKEFYTTKTGASRFRSMENSGNISNSSRNYIPQFCRSLCAAGRVLILGLDNAHLSAALLDDLTLITLGPQLRGGRNVQLGSAAIEVVFNIIRDIVQESIVEINARSIKVLNAARRGVSIECAADPDIVIREAMQSGDSRKIIAIEVKGGTDFSNVHNRVGEAEKSHQKAKKAGYVECWTVVNVDQIDVAMAHRESPSTNRFYRISQLVAEQGDEYNDFQARIISLIGI